MMCSFEALVNNFCVFVSEEVFGNFFLFNANKF